MVKHPMLSDIQMSPFRARFGDKKIFAQALMPVRGPEGFRELDYDFANKIDPEAIIKKIKENGFNAFGLVVKDTDGATLADVPSAWNPTGRDLCGEFSEVCEKYDILYMLSITNMNDAYRGYTHPETVSIHFKNPRFFGKDHKAGDPATHYEGEMRVKIPEGMTFEEMKKKIPFLTNKFDAEVGPSRDMRGRGYIPMTSFHCPRSEHADYMVQLVSEIVKKYKVDGVLADYIRYHHGYTDLCGCERCRTAFAEQYPGKKFGKGEAWIRFRLDNVINFGKRFNDAVKSAGEDIVTGWFNLPGPKIYSERLVAQDYHGLTSVMDSALPMVYPYLMGTADDGKKWGRMGNMAYWYTKRNMAKRFHEYSSPNDPKSVFCITNSVECNAEEMLKQSIAFDYGLGISLFKYYGTKEDQWYACKLYSEILTKQNIGEKPPSIEDIHNILIKVYEKYPPKVIPKWYKRYLAKQKKAKKIKLN
ncbi:MAG: family 10 glycosylhydrolase [Promethearchaeota archaeon]